MRTRTVIGVMLFGLAGGSTLPTWVYGQQNFTSWRLVGTEAKDPFNPRGMQSRGTISVDGVQADARGGVVRLTAKHPTHCPPETGLPAQGGIQRFMFSWRFQEDVSRISASGPISLSFMIDGDRGNGCMDQNPYTQLNTFGDPIAYGDAQSNQGFYFKPNRSHVGGPRTLRVIRRESWRKDASFKIVITDFPT